MRVQHSVLKGWKEKQSPGSVRAADLGDERVCVPPWATRDGRGQECGEGRGRGTSLVLKEIMTP